MAGARSATLSIRLKPETKKRLAGLAKNSGRSSNFLIADAVEVYVSDQEKMLAEVRQADRQIKSGHYIKNEEMKSWLLSWGTDRELPVPKCAGGKHTMTRLCASRDCLIRLGANPAARNSSLYRAGQTGGGGTARHADCSHS
jgi:predicted transcriptional regulator